jgi:hypothetical protein
MSRIHRPGQANMVTGDPAEPVTDCPLLDWAASGAIECSGPPSWTSPRSEPARSARLGDRLRHNAVYGTGTQPLAYGTPSIAGKRAGTRHPALVPPGRPARPLRYGIDRRLDDLASSADAAVGVSGAGARPPRPGEAPAASSTAP